MGTSDSEDARDADRLLQQAAQGDRAAWGSLLERHRGRLKRMVEFHLDRRLQGRIDPSDVIQEAYLEASSRLPEYLQGQSLPFFLWLRLLTRQRLAQLHRFHLKAQVRNAGREISLYQGALPNATSAALAAQLLGRLTRPSEAAVRAEMKVRLQEALNALDPTDREVLALRHFERLSTSETATVLGISEEATKKRHIRAIRRLKEVLSSMPGGAGGDWP
jgi:RNA polymerase sigma-70 factor (ECF subfamily)